MMDLRADIKAALKRQGRSIYWLATHDDVTCRYDTTYRWLARKSHAIHVRHIDAMLQVLGMTIGTEHENQNNHRPTD